MATKPFDMPLPALQRGKACLRCRKRKMRCDGVKPTCQQCVRAKKPDLCQYDDGKTKTKTQMLRENIERLEQRIKELEDPDYVPPVVSLQYPQFHRRSESDSSSSTDSPDSAVFSTPHSPFPPSVTGSPQESWVQFHMSPSPTPSDACQVSQQPSAEFAQMLVDTFAPHRHQCLLGLHMGRLRDSFTKPPSEQHHPVLTNAIFLWACYLSRPAPLSEHEYHFLSRALEALSDGLQRNQYILDVIQASCLLSLYFLSNGRAMEGSCHATTAASLAMQCGLHGVITGQTTFESSGAFSPCRLDQPKDAIEQGERILTFWQVFIIDRCWSAVLQKPAIIPDGPEGCLSVIMPWPQGMKEYELGQINGYQLFSTASSYLEDGVSRLSDSFSPVTLRIKASVLFQHAHHLTSRWEQRRRLNHTDYLSTTENYVGLTLPNTFSDEFHALEQAISRYLSSQIPIHQLDSAMPEDRQACITAYTLANVAMVNLNYSLGDADPAAYEKCLRAARCCVSLVEYIAETDYEFLDPILGPCWSFVVDALVRELYAIEASWPLVSSADVRHEIGTMLYAMNNLGKHFPSVAYSLSKVQKRLSGI
ncbi:hypothetical protein PISMIDRAFT_373909 [Pisolithus microcarpus 441]|uniref:Zn(2)-C6 fungal-type domain-containing protein n=1 Tax=Pisolithus microcarpus 441 TaxID=765257 RepID=A0A0C9ZR66_9AGAM|nr:hypothetical protein PISMIDRAFT_373909 [Pisolithus microcarpus 441]